MNRKMKLIWDFFGEDAAPMAKHHAIHLKEFAEKESIEFHDCGTEALEDLSAMAFLTVNESDMIMVRDALKPKRGQWV